MERNNGIKIYSKLIEPYFISFTVYQTQTQPLVQFLILPVQPSNL